MKKKISYLSCLLLLFFFGAANVYSYSNMNKDKVSCGSGMIKNMPKMIPDTVRIVYLALQIAVPVLIVIFGSIDLIKAISAGKEDDIKKAQSTFLRRLALGALVFFLFAIVKILVGTFGDNSAKILDCFNCFVNGCK